MSVRASISERVGIEGPAGNLECIVEDVGADAQGFAVVCHPHPLFGGTMDNKVVVSIARALQESRISTIRFNFRGVGSSAGTYDEGRGECADAQSVADWGARRWPALALTCAGFSFGSYVALQLALSRPTARLITIAPAVTRFDFNRLKRPDCPWLIVQGDADDVVDPQAVIDWAGSLSPPVTLVLMPGSGHFFHGKLIELKEIVLAEIRSGASRSGA